MRELSLHIQGIGGGEDTHTRVAWRVAAAVAAVVVAAGVGVCV